MFTRGKWLKWSVIWPLTHTFRKTIGRLQIILNSRRIPPRDRMFLRFARAAMTPPRPLKRKRDGDDDGRMLSPKRRRSKWMANKLPGLLSNPLPFSL